MSTQSCRQCTHGAPSNYINYVRCTVPVPAWVEDRPIDRLVIFAAAPGCECFERKEGENGASNDHAQDEVHAVGGAV